MPRLPALPAVIITRPMVAVQDRFCVSADAENGSLRVEIIDEPGFSAGNCETISGNVTDMEIVWKGGKTPAALKQKTVRLKFILDNARLYAFSGLDLAPPAP